jgi:hypothetical protein
MKKISPPKKSKLIILFSETLKNVQKNSSAKNRKIISKNNC